jgi:hypothetical protein
VVYIHINNELEKSIKIEVISLKNNFQIHRQVERKNGLTFMRLKKRKLF